MDDVPMTLRNGTPKAAPNLLVRHTIPTAYHWTPITDMEPTDALSYVEAYIACARKMINENTSAVLSEAQRRKVAICLGVSRAVATAYYNITTADLNPEETASAYMSYRPTQPPPVEGPKGKVFLAHGLSETVAAALIEPLQLTEEEENVVTVLRRCTLGTLPLQGLSLILTNHQYLSENTSQSRRAFAAVERQFWRENPIKAWVEADKTLLQDVLWHKACHPVNLTIKYRLACSESVKEQLVLAGCGSAAARLPAMETEAKAATAYLHLFEYVEPMFKMYGGGINCDMLRLALDVHKCFEPGVERPSRPAELGDKVPPSVVNRRTAVAWLSDIVKRNGSTAAICYGFYCAMSERSMMTGSAAGNETLRYSFALRKLTFNYASLYTFGFELYSDYAVARAKDRKSGKVL